MSDTRIKVTDKRMFTPDGKLKEEYRHLEDGDSQGAAGPVSEPQAPPAAEPPRSAPQPEPEVATLESTARVEIPRPDDGVPAPTFVDLVGMLAEPIAVYLGEVQLPDGGSMENLDMARLHIDLLEVLRQKTAGNLDLQEMSFLEDLLYQFRLRYVRKRG